MGSVEKAGIIVVAILILIIAGVGLMNRNDAESGAGKKDVVASNSRTDVKKPRAKPSRLTGRHAPKPIAPRTTRPKVAKPSATAKPNTTQPPIKGVVIPGPKVATSEPVKVTQPTRTVATPKVVKAAAPAPKIPKSYKIQSGDVLSKVAFRTYGTTRMVGQIVRANPGMNADQLSVGQELKLPPMDSSLTAATTASKPSSGSKSGPAAASVRPATRPGFITAAYIAGNKGGAAAAKTAAPKGSYRIKSGDTVSSIAEKQLGSVRHTNRLVAANQALLKNPNRLQVGWLIKLPAVN